MKSHRKTRFRPQVENVEGRQLLSTTAVVEVLNQSSSKLTFEFRWASNDAWQSMTESPGQGELFYNNYSTTLTPQVQYNHTTSTSSQTLVNLSQGYSPWNSTDSKPNSSTPPSSAATLYEFLNSSGGVTLYNEAPTEPYSAVGYSADNSELFGPNGPSYLDVQQGMAGDCWLLASLAEVAARDPQDIRNMFTYDGTTVVNGATVGLYRVRFFNSSGVAEYVTVNTELPDGGTYYDRTVNQLTNNNILWVALAEKAYAEAAGDGYVQTSYLPSDSYSSLDGGNPTWALRAITGEPASGFSVNPGNIAAAWNAGDLIVMSSSSNPSSSDIVGDHAYAVVGYNPSSSMPYEIYNPWGMTSSGMAQGTYDGHAVYGQFWASAALVSQNFSGQSLTYATAQTGSSGQTLVVSSLDQDDPAAVDSSSTQATRGQFVEPGEGNVIDPMRVFSRKGSMTFGRFASSM